MNFQGDNFTKKIKSLTGGLVSHNEFGVFAPLAIFLVIVGFINFDFFAPNNLIDILRSTSYTFIVAAPITLLFIVGGLDLSIGATTALGSVVCGWSLALFHFSIFTSIMLVLAAGLIVGIFKSLLSWTFGLPEFIITLGITKLIDSFILVTTDGVAITGFDNDAFKTLGQGKAFGEIYWTIIIAIAIGIALQILLTRTKFGRQACACGGNTETAKLAGINVNRIRFSVEIMVSMFAAFCGACYCSRFNSGQTSIGEGNELTIMAAAIIGGTSMFGGTGSIIGSFFGCLLLAVINNGLILMHVSTDWKNMIFGAILIISLFIDKYRREKSGGAA